MSRIATSIGPVGSWGLLGFRKWPDRGRTKAPEASPAELMAVMTEVEDLATDVGAKVSLVDNAIWLLCARSGLSLTNEELTELIG